MTSKTTMLKTTIPFACLLFLAGCTAIVDGPGQPLEPFAGGDCTTCECVGDCTKNAGGAGGSLPEVSEADPVQEGDPTAPGQGEQPTAPGQAVPKKATDLFLLIGQSNAVGFGLEAPSITSAQGAYEIDYAGNTNTLMPLAYPTGRGSGAGYESQNFGFALALASQWSSLGSESVFVFAGVPGSALVEAADNGTDGDWTDVMDDDGLYSSALTLLNNARSTIQNSADRTLGRIIVVWHQGETDALAPAVHQQDYLSAINALYFRLFNDIAFDAFFVSSIGFTTDDPGANTLRFIDIMDALEAFADSWPRSALVSRKAMNLTRHCFGEGLGSAYCGLGDDYHYQTSVYESLGTDIALIGWSFITSGTRLLTASTYPSAEVRCLGSTATEAAIVTVYNQHCHRCPSMVDLNYWAAQVSPDNLTAVLTTIQNICSGFGYPGWTRCRRQNENARLGGCPPGWDHLPVYSRRCFRTCQS